MSGSPYPLLASDHQPSMSTLRALGAIMLQWLDWLPLEMLGAWSASGREAPPRWFLDFLLMRICGGTSASLDKIRAMGPFLMPKLINGVLPITYTQQTIKKIQWVQVQTHSSSSLSVTSPDVLWESEQTWFSLDPSLELLVVLFQAKLFSS